MKSHPCPKTRRLLNLHSQRKFALLCLPLVLRRAIPQKPECVRNLPQVSAEGSGPRTLLGEEKASPQVCFFSPPWKTREKARRRKIILKMISGHCAQLTQNVSKTYCLWLISQGFLKLSKTIAGERIMSAPVKIFPKR